MRERFKWMVSTLGALYPPGSDFIDTFHRKGVLMKDGIVDNSFHAVRLTTSL